MSILSGIRHAMYRQQLSMGAVLTILIALGCGSANAMAQTLDASKIKSPQNASPAQLSTHPLWQELTPDQQVSLKPLASQWNSLREVQKKKWMTISAGYARLAPAEQVKLHSRMTQWMSLSQQERAQARLNFSSSKQLSPTQKAATWEAYQALSPEEKQKLATTAAPKPKGAATAVKQVPAHKLATVPQTRSSAKLAPKVAAIDQNTLLPTNPSPAEPLPPLKN